MINKTHCTYCLFSQPIIETFMFHCIDKSEDSILLQNPRLIYTLSVNIEKTSYSVQSPTISLDSHLIDINNRSNKQNNNSSIKFEKKTKNSFLLNDNINSKKNKIVGKKKKHNKLDLEQEDFFVDDSNTETESHDLKNSPVKPAKSRKTKRKYKSKQGISNVDFIYNSQNADNKSSYNVENSFDKEIILDSPLTIEELAYKIKVSEASIITWLFLQAISVTINQVVDVSIATKVAKHYGFSVIRFNESLSKDSIKEKPIISDLEHSIKRAPVITVFGHVDHGKTTLLDYIRNTNVVNKEAGGITQSLNGYEVNYNYEDSLEKLVFLDTPGHEAFTAMRLRSAEVTDIAILLVAADDGLKLQSIEAINHIKSRDLPYIIVINKIDKEDTDLDKIKNQLSQYDIISTEWGGQDRIITISALTGLNIDTLLCQVCELSNTLNLRANLHHYAEGTIIESYLNKTIGPIATVVIKNGTLNLGDIIVSGCTYGKIKSIISSEGKKLNKVNASAVVQICGFSIIPQAGLKFHCVDQEKTAKYLVSKYITDNNSSENTKLLNTRVTLESYNDQTKIKTVNLILKADTQGSIGAIIYAFSQIPQNKVQINLISFSPGSVFEKDINLACTSHSIILGFNISILSNIRSIAERLHVVVKEFDVIYDLIDYLKQYMINLLAPEYDKFSIGEAIVQTVFNMNKGSVAGCLVQSGIIKQGSYLIVHRKDEIIYEGLLTSLKRLKNNVDQVIEGNECGVMCINYDLWQQEDRIEAFEMIQKEKVL